MASSYTKKQLEDIVAGLNTKLESMEQSLSALKDLPTRVSNLESLLKTSNEKCTNLVTALENKEKEVQSLSLKLNGLEQHHRSWSIRVNGLHISSEGANVKEELYNSLLKPILEGACEMGDIRDVPTVDQVLEHAHVLPSKDRSKPKPVIARFYSREMRSLIFRHKRAFAPREASNSADRSTGRYSYPFFEDLTKLNFGKMRALAVHPRVDACWSTGGQLRYKLKDNTTVFRVSNILDTVENILSTTV